MQRTKCAHRVGRQLDRSSVGSHKTDGSHQARYGNVAAASWNFKDVYVVLACDLEIDSGIRFELQRSRTQDIIWCSRLAVRPRMCEVPDKVLPADPNRNDAIVHVSLGRSSGRTCCSEMRQPEQQQDVGRKQQVAPDRSPAKQVREQWVAERHDEWPAAGARARAVMRIGR